MLKNYVGKWLFPRLQRSQYNHEFKIIAVSIVFGLLVGGGVAAVLIWRGAVGK
jgi:hypothetical protein